MKCCPSNLLSPPPPPLPRVNKYTVYTYTVCKGEGRVWGHMRGGGLRQIKHPVANSPYKSIFLYDDILLGVYIVN